MAKPNVLGLMAKQAGLTVPDCVARAVEEAGSQMGAARALGVNVNTVRYHLRKAGKSVVTRQTATVTAKEGAA